MGRSQAFSTLGWENYADSTISGVQTDQFFCAQPAAREITETLINDVGLNPVYLGDLDTAQVLDGLTRLWFTLAFGQGLGRRLAFKMLLEK